MKKHFFKRDLLRVVDPFFKKEEGSFYGKQKTISLDSIMIGTVVKENIAWLDVEIIDENNYSKLLGAPFNKNGKPSHSVLQDLNRAKFVVVSVSQTESFERIKEIIKEYSELPSQKRPKAIILEGWDLFENPLEFLLLGAKVVVHGEGEVVICELLSVLQNDENLENVPGISFLKNGEFTKNRPEFLSVSREEFEFLPEPDFALAKFAITKIFPLVKGFLKVKRALRRAWISV